jgi:hypothetical protein
LARTRALGDFGALAAFAGLAVLTIRRRSRR